MSAEWAEPAIRYTDLPIAARGSLTVRRTWVRRPLASTAVAVTVTRRIRCFLT
jgi:hypothetical protein